MSKLRKNWKALKDWAISWALIVGVFAIFIIMIGFSCADNIGRVYFWWTH